MKLAMTGKSMLLMLLAGATILALGMLACMDTNSALIPVRGSFFLKPANGRHLSNTAADVMPRQLQDDMGSQSMGSMGSMGSIGDLVSFFEQNIMLLWLLVLILGCCGCHTVAHYMSYALYGISYLELCMGRRPMMGMGGIPMGMGGMGGYPMAGGMGGGNPMGGMGGGYPMGSNNGGYPMGGSGHQHHHHASGGGNMQMGDGGYHGGFTAHPVHHGSYGPAGRQPDGSWKF